MIILKKVGIAFGVFLVAWIGWGTFMSMSTPEPPYDVLKTFDSDVEIRSYEAQTWITAPTGEEGSSFRLLASYIFGDNAQDQRIAMTAPVISDDQMSFILPKQLTEDTAPAPNGQEIEFTGIPARQVATIGFSWWADPDRVRSKTRTLRETLAHYGIETEGAPFLMRYNDPWTPPFMRRNEVGLVVTNPASGDGV